MTEEKSIEEKLNDMEEKINSLILQVNSLKHQITSNPELEQITNMLKIVTNALQISQAPFTLFSHTRTLTQRLLHRYPNLKFDDISKAIIKALERKEQLNLSQLTEEVRKERGSASRRIVRERVEKLISDGIVEEIDEGFGRQIRLVPIEEE
ncbi:MAG: hypothetical protein ACTSQE_06020 [Candidatus Heimdallarchaeaceae archaeon]